MRDIFTAIFENEPRDPTEAARRAAVAGGAASTLEVGAGEYVAIVGESGIGKSTLLLQALAVLAARCRTLYVSGEESASQIALRANRLGLAGCDIPILTEIRLESVLASHNVAGGTAPARVKEAVAAARTRVKEIRSSVPAA